MAPILQILTSVLPSLPDSGGDIEALVGLSGASNSLNSIQEIAVNLPTITQTQSVFVTETQLLTATVTSFVQMTTTVTTIVTFRPSATKAQTLKPVSSTSSTSMITSLSSMGNVLVNASTSVSSSSVFSSSSSPPLTTTQSPQIPGVPARTALPDESSFTLSSGAVVGITLASVLFTLLLVICFVRQRLRRKRVKDRTWVTPFVVEKPVLRPSVNQRQQKRMEYLAERWGRIRSLRRHERLGQNGYRGEASSSARMGDEGQPTRRRNPRNNGQTSTLQSSSVAPPPAIHREQPSARRPVRDSPFVSSLFPHGAVAKLNFEPIRPDELAVSAGDHLRVIALYDDGWALCRNDFRGKGMVPTACLRVNEVGRVG